MTFRNTLVCFTCLALLTCSSPSENETIDVPKYPLEAFFNTAVIYPASYPFSHDQSRILISSDRSGSYNFYAYPADGGEPVKLTNFSAGSNDAIGWFPTDDRILYTGDQDGNERYSLWVLEEDGTSTSLIENPEASSEFISWNENDRYFYVVSDERERPFKDLYKYDADTYAREMIFQNNDDYIVAGISDDGQMIALEKILSNKKTNLILYDLVKGSYRQISSDTVDVKHKFSSFGPDGSIYYLTDEFDEFTQVWKFNPDTGEHMLAAKSDWDIQSLTFSSKGTYKIIRTNENGSRIVRAVTDGPELPEAAAEASGLVFSPDEQKVLIIRLKSIEPFHIQLLDLETSPPGLTEIDMGLDPRLDPDHLVKAEPVWFESYDGLEIPGLLYKPRQARAEHPVPVIIYVHGGPGGQSYTYWDERHQHLVNQGYAVYAINNRGSSGYGKTFYHLDDRRHGDVDLEDVIAAKKWLSGMDWVDKDRFVIKGDSYGGYMTLAALCFYPDEFNLGISGFPAVNWVRTLTIAKDRLGPWAVEQYAEIGHPVEDREYLESISPYFHMDKINKPLLLISGENDPRFDPQDAEDLVAELKRRNIPVRHMKFGNEGHYTVNLDNRIAEQQAVIDFLHEYLK